MHGWPYDIYSFVDVAPILASAGYRVIVPYLRGYGTTRFLSSETFRNGQPSVTALDTIADVDASGIWPGKVVTEIKAVGPFWQAEPEHQDYLERYPNGYTCHFVRPNWSLPHRAA